MLKTLALVTASLLAFTACAKAGSCEAAVERNELYQLQYTMADDFYSSEPEILDRVMEKIKLEIEAICDVKENRGKTSRYWTLPTAFTWEELEFAAGFL